MPSKVDWCLFHCEMLDSNIGSSSAPSEGNAERLLERLTKPDSETTFELVEAARLQLLCSMVSIAVAMGDASLIFRLGIL